MFDAIPSTSGIYAIVNTRNGHRYVGQAKNMKARVQSHFRDLEKGIHRTNEAQLLQRGWDKFGCEVFEFVVLEQVVDNSAAVNYHVRPDNLSLAEHFYINQQSEYNADKRIVREEFKVLIENKSWRVQTQMRIHHLDHLVLTVADIVATCAFYERVLGMKTVTFGANRHALSFGEQKINLHQAGSESEPKAHRPTPGSGDLCFITLVPIEDVAAHLEACGVPILEGPVERTGATGALLSVYFRDLDLNLIEVSNLK